MQQLYYYFVLAAQLNQHESKVYTSEVRLVGLYLLRGSSHTLTRQCYIDWSTAQNGNLNTNRYVALHLRSSVLHDGRLMSCIQAEKSERATDTKILLIPIDSTVCVHNLWCTYSRTDAFLTLDEAIASRVVFVIVSGRTGGRTGGR